MQPDVAALSACCLDAMAAKNGHGRRWAVARCVRALQAAPGRPASPMVDEMAASAMVAVAETINRTTVSPLKPGA
jgi:hypothetical protein